MAEPTYPIDERIIQAIETAMKTISVANGYKTDIAEVERPRLTGEGNNPKDKGIYIVAIADELMDEGDIGDGEPPSEWRLLTVACDVCVRLSENDTRPVDQVLSIIKADVIKAAMTDRYLGGLAMNTTEGDSTYYARKGVEGVVVEFQIQYATAANDKYENRI